MKWQRVVLSSLLVVPALATAGCGSAQIREDVAEADPSGPSRYAWYDHKDVPEAAAPAPSSGGAASPDDSSADRDEAQVQDEPAAKQEGGGAVQFEAGDDDDEP